MKYFEFESIMSRPRMLRYLTATGNDTRKAMTVYRKNLRLSQELFTVISCFEISLKNCIDRHYSGIHGNEWLIESSDSGGFFDNHNCRHTRNLIRDASSKLSHHYTHVKLLAFMDFGFWRHLFAQPQFRAGGQSLLRIFPAKLISTPTIQYNHTYVFNQLGQINNIRNRIAHHEPICFAPGQPLKDTSFVRQHHALILQLFHWVNIEEAALLYGLDHIISVCNEVNAL